MKKIFTLLCVSALTCGFAASAYDLVTFEDVGLSANTYYSATVKTSVQSGDFLFAYNGHAEYGGYWNGITVASMTANTSASLTDQYNTITGGGNSGSSAYAVAYYSQYDASPSTNNEYPSISSSSGATFYPEYVYVTNTAYAYTSMLNGDSYAKQFTASDYLVIHFYGIDSNGDAGTPVDFYLAKDGNIVNEWTKVDLSSLGEVASIRIEMESTDVSYGYYNTPTYFALDDFKASKQGSSAIADLDTTPATVEAVYDLRGIRYNELQQGVNIVRMSDGTTRKDIIK